jgi:outer membrane receptor protein involved in Fe transport
MHRLISLVIGIIVLHFMAAACAAGQTPMAASPASPVLRDTAAQRHADTVRTIDSLSYRTVDTVKHAAPLRSVGSLSPQSLLYPGIDADGIRWKDYRTTSDLLSGVPGVFVREMSSPGQEYEVTVNGAEHTGTAFLVDGISQTNPTTGTYNFAFFPIEAIDHLEIVTGPRSFLYGDNAVGGTINAVTKSFSNNKPYTHIRYSQSGDSYSQTDAMFSQNIFPRVNLSFGLSYLGYGSDHWFQDENRGRYPNADNEAYTFRTKLRYNVSPTVNLAFTHFYYRTQTGLNGGVDITKTLQAGANVYDENAATVVNLESYEKRYNHHAALTAAYRPLADTLLTASVTLYGNQQRRELRDEANRSSPSNGIIIKDDFGSRVLGARGQIDYAAGGNLLSAIGETKQTRYGNSIYGTDRSYTRSSLSVKDELSFGTIATVAAFGKSNVDFAESTTDFGADASLHLPGSVTLSAGASIAHRRPVLPEVSFGAGGADTVARKILAVSNIITPFPDDFFLLPNEVHHVAEASVRFTPGENLQAGVTATRRRIEHWIDRSSLTPIWWNDLTIDCMTASLRLRHGNFFLEGEAAYTRQTEVLRGSTPVRLFPEWRGDGSVYFRGKLANGNLDLKAGVRGKFYSAFDGEQFSAADAVLIAAAGGTIVNRPIGNAGTVDIFVVAHIGDAYIHVMWENLTNSAYMLTPFYPMYGRTLRFGVSWEFVD